MRTFLIELNEVNFDFVEAYASRGLLPNLSRLCARHGLTETLSENSHEHLEPWIQWVTAHTGLSYADHGVFRLGDILEATDIDQIWEVLEKHNIQVGAISPMNANNRCQNPKFFIPDPWTPSASSGRSILTRLHSAIAQAVNDNADQRITPSSAAWILLGLTRYARLENYAQYARMLIGARRQKWARAMVLDQLLADVFITEAHLTNVEFASLFLNAAAHIQHHYMFNSAVYKGPHRNPDWYVSANDDPVYEVYALYDRIVGQIAKAFPDCRLLIATGLHQTPYPTRTFYWRLRNPGPFLSALGINMERVEQRMSRDFVVYCKSEQEAAHAETILKTAKTVDGLSLFEVDNRGNDLFVMLTYPHEITDTTQFGLADGVWRNLLDEVAFVAIKNGEHDGTGYLIDTSAKNGAQPEQIALGDLFNIVCDHFCVARKPDTKSVAA
jgi:hypothetical protein